MNDMLLTECYVLVMSPTTNRLIMSNKVHDVATSLHAAQRWWNVWMG